MGVTGDPCRRRDSALFSLTLGAPRTGSTPRIGPSTERHGTQPEGLPALPNRIPPGTINAKCVELGLDPKPRAARADHLAVWEASQRKRPP